MQANLIKLTEQVPSTSTALAQIESTSTLCQGKIRIAFGQPTSITLVNLAAVPPCCLLCTSIDVCTSH
jgi:hypothetical protein